MTPQLRTVILQMKEKDEPHGVMTQIFPVRYLSENKLFPLP